MVQIVGKEVASNVHDLGPRRAEAGGVTRAPAFVRRSVGKQIFLQLDGKEKLAAFAMARRDTTSDFFEATLRMCFVKSTLTFWRRLAEQVPSVETTEEAVGVLPQAARRRQERLHAERRTDGEICGGAVENSQPSSRRDERAKPRPCSRPTHENEKRCVIA
ncbi:hypothetical protein MY3296_007231 [Beauveria thailandica]